MLVAPDGARTAGVIRCLLGERQVAAEALTTFAHTAPETVDAALTDRRTEASEPRARLDDDDGLSADGNLGKSPAPRDALEGPKPLRQRRVG